MVKLVSERFASAACAEQARLEKRRDKLKGELEQVEGRIATLAEDSRYRVERQEGLRGRRIREVAIPILREDRGTARVHYRDWLRLVEEAGHTIAGKRPDSVFLNQVTRSPEVRATTSRGFYQLVGD